ncbi:MAG: MBL fold metallo-hydrolase [Bacillota bacterium]
MQSKYIIWHIYHSGVVIYNKKSNNIHIFDYYMDPGKILPDIIFDLNDLKTVNIYVSHGHHDHYNPEIFNWDLNNYKTNFILSSDLKEKINLKKKQNIYFIKSGDEVNLKRLHIKAYPSTDLGISFYIKEDKSTFFHGGDLNWWDWESFSQEEKIKEEKDFKNAIDKIKNKDIDIACLAIDPRLKESFHLAAEYFNSTVKPQFIVPLHFKDDYKIIDKYINKIENNTNILEFNYPGDKVII